MAATELPDTMTVAGLALIATGLGIRYAYAEVLSLRHNPEQLASLPAQLQRVFPRFIVGAYLCMGVGVALTVASLLMTAGDARRPALDDAPVSIVYAAALGLLLALLSYNVLRHRVRDALSGTPDPETSARIARVHANFTEYAPTGLILLMALEWAGASATSLHIGGTALVAGRYLHAWGYTHQPVVSFGRIVGIQTTLFALLYLGLMLLWTLSG